MKKVCLFVLGLALLALAGLLLLPHPAVAADETDHPSELPSASGEADESSELPSEPLEQYDMPPAPMPLWGIGVSPGMISVHDQFTSHQVNVNASGLNITGDAANEPSIAVDPTNGNRMVIGWRQFNSVSSNFRQSGYGYTSNGGSTWTFPGVLENNVFRSDPVLVADDIGRFFYNSLLETFFDNIWRSLDSGQTWTNLQGAGNATGGDKQWHQIDNTNSTGHGFQYQAWSTAGNNFGGRQFSRSTDGGVTWMDPINIPNSPIWGTLDVDSNGNLFIGGVNGSFRCLRSSNAKNGAVTPTFDQNVVVNMGGTITSSQTINPGGLTGQLFLAVDRSGTATNNNIYMLASVRPTGAGGGADVRFARSTNGGVSFSASIRINDDAVNASKWHWMGTLSVAPNGRIDSVWLDTRNAANNTDSQLFYSYSTDGGVTWAPNVSVSNSFNPFLGYPQQNKMGDYMTIVSDNTGANVAYAATFNLEEDIYYVRVAPAGPTQSYSSTPPPSPTPPATPSPTATVPPTPTPTPPIPTPTPSPTVTPTPSEAPRADISAAIADSPDPDPVGHNLTYTITVSNGGPQTAPSATMSDNLPASVNFVSVTPSQGSCSGTSLISCALGDLPAFSSATVTLVVTPTVTGTLSNTAFAAASAIDPNQLNNSATASTMILPTGTPSPTIPPSTPTPTPPTTPSPTATVPSTPSPTATPTATPTASPPATPSATPTASPTATPTATPPAPAQALNISTRLRVETGDNVMIGGFIITGNAPKPVVLRAIGPSLASSGIPAGAVLADPVLELRGSNGALIMRNDNWKDDQRALIEGTIYQPTDDRESVILSTLSQGAYTAIVTGKAQTTGVGLVEIYDSEHGLDAELANISTRGFVQTGDNVMIGGFILGGSTANTHVVVRGIGPSIQTIVPVGSVLADPTLELHDGNGALLIANDNWQDDSTSAAQLSARGLALNNPLESGIFASLPPGAFTAILAGKNGTPGVGLIEIYNVH